jgi:acyl-coenzyme A thioesterase PaaI-like protein
VNRTIRASQKARAETMAGLSRLRSAESVFGIEAAGRLMTEVMAPWVQDLGLLIESIEAGRPPGAPADWQPGAVLRLPFSKHICRDGVVCGQALMGLADAAMMFAYSAAWNGYRPMSAIDQTTHFLRPVNFDVIADARLMRIGRAASFGRATLYCASDQRPVGMVSSAYAVL